MSEQSNQRKSDMVDVFLKQWQKERPDLDISPMGPIGRIKRCASLLERRLESKFADLDLTLWEFDMLATLRRSGVPYCLSPTELFSLLMVTSGTMTHRLKRLENRNLIKRISNVEDARSTLVQLTDKGLELIDHAVEEHLENEQMILAEMPTDILNELDRHLSMLLQTLETPFIENN
jgi:DNA-binding MarR family transcriptional regulator